MSPQIEHSIPSSNLKQDMLEEGFLSLKRYSVQERNCTELHLDVRLFHMFHSHFLLQLCLDHLSSFGHRLVVLVACYKDWWHIGRDDRVSQNGVQVTAEEKVYVINNRYCEVEGRFEFMI